MTGSRATGLWGLVSWFDYPMRLQGMLGDTLRSSNGLRFHTITQSADALNLVSHGPRVKEQPSPAHSSPSRVSQCVQEERLLDQFPSEFGVKSCSTPFEQGILNDRRTGTNQRLHPQGGFAVARFDQDGVAHRQDAADCKPGADFFGQQDRRLSDVVGGGAVGMDR